MCIFAFERLTVYCVDSRKSEGLVSSPALPGEPSPSRNQHSGRKDQRANSDVMVIPDPVFYEDNSFRPLEKVDLSDWTCFCSERSPVFAQMGERLSIRCLDLNLSGLTALATPQGTKRCSVGSACRRSMPPSRCVQVSSPC